jgi:hypothetical protein
MLNLLDPVLPSIEMEVRKACASARNSPSARHNV